MGSFRYKTKNDSSPNGKYKVYLCAHEDEVYDYLEEISRLILPQYSECVIWYYDKNIDEENALAGKMYAETLSHMSLFVVPVTEKFLEKDSRALTYDLKFAKDHNVPILFLLQDDDLVDKFNIVCGKLHLIKESDDQFKEKVDQFLSMFFVDNKLKRRIKKSFDAQIFISYRKLDRLHADRVISLIHKHYKTVSVWFDDYLTSGEKFDTEIMSELKKSDLMTLVVTPNVLPKGNYVREREYRKAKVAQKKIIPIEVESTDKKELSLAFPGIDDCFDISDEDVIVAAIEKELGKHQRKSKIVEDEKQYLLGLAYLMGINVVRNAALAYRVIKNSADSGNYEAMDRLYRMYRTGDYVKADYKQAINWKLRSIRILCKLALSARYGYQREKYCVEYVNSCLELLNYRDDIVNDYYGYDELDEDFIYSSQTLDGIDQEDKYALRFYTENMSTLEGTLNLFIASVLNRYHITDKIRLVYAKALLYNGKYLAEQLNDTSQFDSIRENYEYALSLLEKVTVKNVEIQRTIAGIYIGLAQIDNASKLMQYTSKAIEILEKLRDENTENYDILINLEKAYCLRAGAVLGDWNISKSILLREEYKKYTCRAVELMKDIVALSDTRKNVSDLRDLYSGIVYKNADCADIIGVFSKDECDLIYREVSLLEDKLEKKWKVPRKHTGDGFYAKAFEQALKCEG